MAKYTAEFRQLGWKGHHALIHAGAPNYQKSFLIHALVSVDGVEVKTIEDASRILSTLPKTFINKLWVLYSAALPSLPFYTTKGLYSAPAPQDMVRKQTEIETSTDDAMEKALKRAEARFGPENLKHAQSIEQKILEASKKRGLQPATREDV